MFWAKFWRSGRAFVAGMVELCRVLQIRLPERSLSAQEIANDRSPAFMAVAPSGLRGPGLLQMASEALKLMTMRRTGCSGSGGGRRPIGTSSVGSRSLNRGLAPCQCDPGAVSWVSGRTAVATPGGAAILRLWGSSQRQRW